MLSDEKRDQLMRGIPDDDSGDALRRMLAGGDSLTKPRDINFSVVFTDAKSAEDFACPFREKGLKVEITENGCVEDKPWDVTVTKHMVPTHAGITAFEKELEEAAASLNGRNDGWGCFREED